MIVDEYYAQISRWIFVLNILREIINKINIALQSTSPPSFPPLISLLPSPLNSLPPISSSAKRLSSTSLPYPFYLSPPSLPSSPSSLLLFLLLPLQLTWKWSLLCTQRLSPPHLLVVLMVLVLLPLSPPLPPSYLSAQPTLQLPSL